MKPQIRLLLMVIVLLFGAMLVWIGNPTHKADLSGVAELAGDLQKQALKPVHVATRVSDAEEMRVGASIAERIHSSYSPTTTQGKKAFNQAENYLRNLGNRVARHVSRPGIKYKFHLLKYDHVNAFALPGGQIYIYQGLLDFAKDEAQLAFVIGHEITHVDQRHCIDLFQGEIFAGRAIPSLFNRDLYFLAKLTTQFVHRVLVGGYQKYQEFEADLKGQKLMADAGYDPQAAVEITAAMLEHYGEPSSEKRPENPVKEILEALNKATKSYFHSHPPGLERLAKLKAALPTFSTTTTWQRKPESLQKIQKALKDAAASQRESR